MPLTLIGEAVFARCLSAMKAERVEAAKEYARTHENYQFSFTKVKGFHNIQITCHQEKWCMVSKNKAPSIHFVIHHPKLRYALENVVLPIRDEGLI